MLGRGNEAGAQIVVPGYAYPVTQGAIVARMFLEGIRIAGASIVFRCVLSDARRDRGAGGGLKYRLPSRPGTRHAFAALGWTVPDWWAVGAFGRAGSIRVHRTTRICGARRPMGSVRLGGRGSLREAKTIFGERASASASNGVLLAGFPGAGVVAGGAAWLGAEDCRRGCSCRA